jgi:hypothetical protein
LKKRKTESSKKKRINDTKRQKSVLPTRQRKPRGMQRAKLPRKLLQKLLKKPTRRLTRRRIERFTTKSTKKRFSKPSRNNALHATYMLAFQGGHVCPAHRLSRIPSYATAESARLGRAAGRYAAMVEIRLLPDGPDN